MNRNHWLSELSALVEVETDPDILESYRYDQAGSQYVSAGVPAAVVHPVAADQVVEIVRLAIREKVPLVPRGAGSGLSGGANAADGGITVCLDRMNRILEINEDSIFARVEPGVINNDLRMAAQKLGLDYAPDPASHEFSTLGGNIATNAGGLCCVKYGVTRDSLLSVDLVTGHGEQITLGRPTRKGVAGYDLKSVVCGSEGSLGIITGACLRLMPKRAAAATMAASFTSLADAAAAIDRINRLSSPSLLELLDRTTIAAVEEFAPQGLDRTVNALLFAQSDNGTVALAEVEAMAELCDEAGATTIVTTEELAEGRMLMTARRLAFTALERQGPVILDDVCVPLGRIADLLAGTERVAERSGLTIGTFGHAGDGNFHPTIIYDRSPEGIKAAERAFGEIIELALSLGGTITGEHGVGQLKRTWLERELGASYSLQRGVKRVFDPRGVFVPGSMFPGMSDVGNQSGATDQGFLAW